MLVLIWIMFNQDFDMVKVYMKVQILKKNLSNTTFSLATETFFIIFDVLWKHGTTCTVVHAFSEIDYHLTHNWVISNLK